ncbi:hypothetical protein RCL1_006654 [Eukaryota sp. TZLM3-RCL]
MRFVVPVIVLAVTLMSLYTDSKPMRRVVSFSHALLNLAGAGFFYYVVPKAIHSTMMIIYSIIAGPLISGLLFLFDMLRPTTMYKAHRSPRRRIVGGMCVLSGLSCIVFYETIRKLKLNHLLIFGLPSAVARISIGALLMSTKRSNFQSLNLVILSIYSLIIGAYSVSTLSYYIDSMMVLAGIAGLVVAFDDMKSTPQMQQRVVAKRE